jgi:hypothetical protein
MLDIFGNLVMKPALDNSFNCAYVVFLLNKYSKWFVENESYLYRISSLKKAVLTGATALVMSIEAPCPLQLVSQHKYIGLRKATPLVG